MVAFSHVMDVRALLLAKMEDGDARNVASISVQNAVPVKPI